MSTDQFEALRPDFERLANKNAACGLKRSRKGTYVNPAIARDWKWFQLGAIAIVTGEHSMSAYPAALRTLHDVCARMELEQEATRPTETEYQAAMKVAAALIAKAAGSAA